METKRPSIRELPISALERLASHLHRRNGCWEHDYVGYLGYGTFSYKGHTWRAHHIFFVLLHGDIPQDLVTDHLCRNPRCVNPGHLEAVTNKENLLRGVGVGAINYRKTHCKYGHVLDEANTILETRGGREITRRCRTCYPPKHATPKSPDTCWRGHPYTPENTETYFKDRATGRTGRSCKTCHRMARKIRYAKRSNAKEGQ